MIHLQLNKLRLTARNEGKIKSYDSCTDLRAWSHDVATQDRYLREWMKADSPVCIIPCRCLTDCMCKMTCKSRRRATPYCHPDCKSRAILDSICNSCQAIKECLQQDEDLEKFFVEEELETSHWPCDRCLEALKAITMFWKILMHKLFGINLAKCHGYELNSECMTSVRSVTKAWQADMQQQACYVKKLAPGFCKGSMCKRKTLTPGGLVSSRKSLRSCCTGDNKDIKTISPPCSERVSRCTSIRFKNIDYGCNTSSEVEHEEICAYRRKVAVLQAKCDAQCEDINRLRKENHLLKSEIENIRNGCPWKASFCIPEEKNVCRRSGVCIVPKPFETPLEESCCPVSNVDSEMIITMKNGKNESFRHVSLLQVLHKTNDPILKNMHTNKSCSKKEDPIEILNKVHCTVGAIVKRELCIANERKYQPNNTKVDASFHTVHNCQSAPSCISLSSCSPQSSAAEFVTMYKRFQ